MKIRNKYILVGILGAGILCLGGCKKSDIDKEADTKEELLFEDTYEEVELEETVFDEDKWDVPVVDDTEEDIDILDCVQVGEYKGLTLEKSEIEITEEEVNEFIQNVLSHTAIIDGVAEKGDYVYISYTAETDGKSEVETVYERPLILGEYEMPEEFENAVIGMSVQETKDITVTYPKDYSDADIAGKTVAYHVMVSSITRPYTELTQAWVVENTVLETVEEYREAVKTNLEQAAALDQNNSYIQDAWEHLLANCKVEKYLKSELLEKEQQYDTNIQTYLALSGFTMDEYLLENDMDQETYEKEKYESIKLEAEKSMIMQAIAATENFTSDDAEYIQTIQEEALNSQLTEESYCALYEEDELEKTINEIRALDFVIDCAKK